MSNNNVRMLGEILVAGGAITQKQLELALKKQHDEAARPLPIGEIILRLDYVETDTVIKAALIEQGQENAESAGISYADYLQKIEEEENAASLHRQRIREGYKRSGIVNIEALHKFNPHGFITLYTSAGVNIADGKLLIDRRENETIKELIDRTIKTLKEKFMSWLEYMPDAGYFSTSIETIAGSGGYGRKPQGFGQFDIERQGLYGLQESDDSFTTRAAEAVRDTLVFELRNETDEFLEVQNLGREEFFRRPKKIILAQFDDEVAEDLKKMQQSKTVTPPTSTAAHADQTLNESEDIISPDFSRRKVIGFPSEPRHTVSIRFGFPMALLIIERQDGEDDSHLIDRTIKRLKECLFRWIESHSDCCALEYTINEVEGVLGWAKQLPEGPGGMHVNKEWDFQAYRRETDTDETFAAHAAEIVKEKLADTLEKAKEELEEERFWDNVEVERAPYEK